MPELNEQVVPSGSPRSRLSAGVRRSLGFAAAVIIVVAGTIAIRSLPAGRSFAWFAVSMGLIAIIGIMMAVVWRNMSTTHDLESAIAQLGEGVAQAHEAQVRAEGEAQQKARLAALLDAALTNAPVGFAFFDRELRFLRVNQTFADLTGRDPQRAGVQPLPSET